MSAVSSPRRGARAVREPRRASGGVAAARERAEAERKATWTNSAPPRGRGRPTPWRAADAEPTQNVGRGRGSAPVGNRGEARRRRRGRAAGPTSRAITPPSGATAGRGQGEGQGGVAQRPRRRPAGDARRLSSSPATTRGGEQAPEGAEGRGAGRSRDHKLRPRRGGKEQYAAIKAKEQKSANLGARGPRSAAPPGPKGSLMSSPRSGRTRRAFFREDQRQNTRGPVRRRGRTSGASWARARFEQWQSKLINDLSSKKKPEPEAPVADEADPEAASAKNREIVQALGAVAAAGAGALVVAGVVEAEAAIATGTAARGGAGHGRVVCGGREAGRRRG